MKTYVKPVLRYENFQLNQSVAKCTVRVDTEGNIYSDGEIIGNTSDTEVYGYLGNTDENGNTFTQNS